MMIKNFYQFVQESYKVLDTDSTNVTAIKKELNNMEKWIAEFPRKKSIIDNIYMTFQNNNDLVNKLKSQKIIANFEVDDRNPQRISTTNVKDIKQVEVINPLLTEYIKIAQKRREIKDIEEDISKQKQTIDDRQQDATGNERLAPSFKQDIDNMNSKIAKLQKQIENIESEIRVSEQNMKLKMQQMRQDILRKSKILNTELQNRKQTDITKPEGAEGEAESA